MAHFLCTPVGSSGDRRASVAPAREAIGRALHVFEVSVSLWSCRAAGRLAGCRALRALGAGNASQRSGGRDVRSVGDADALVACHSSHPPLHNDHPRRGGRARCSSWQSVRDGVRTDQGDASGDMHQCNEELALRISQRHVRCTTIERSVVGDAVVDRAALHTMSPKGVSTEQRFEHRFRV